MNYFVFESLYGLWVVAFSFATHFGARIGHRSLTDLLHVVMHIKKKKQLCLDCFTAHRKLPPRRSQITNNRSKTNYADLPKSSNNVLKSWFRKSFIHPKTTKRCERSNFHSDRRSLSYASKQELPDVWAPQCDLFLFFFFIRCDRLVADLLTR